MTECGRCQTCRWWESVGGFARPTYGRCKLATHDGHSGPHDAETNRLRRMHAYGGVGHPVVLHTWADFGCVHHQPAGNDASTLDSQEQRDAIDAMWSEAKRYEREGAEAALEGRVPESNPYDPSTFAASAWLRGYRVGRRPRA